MAYCSFNHTILFEEELVNYLGYNQVDLRLDVCTSVGTCTNAEWQSSFGEPVRITIADPRPPTAELTLTSPLWAAPNTTVVVNGTASSLLGADMADAEVTITWNVQPAASSFGSSFGRSFSAFEDTSSSNTEDTSTGVLHHRVVLFSSSTYCSHPVCSPDVLAPVCLLACVQEVNSATSNLHPAESNRGSFPLGFLLGILLDS